MKPNNSWEIELELLIRKYLYIDPNGLDYWKKLAKMMGENCKVCGKPLVPNKYADEFEKKLLKAITKTLQQQREVIFREMEFNPETDNFELDILKAEKIFSNLKQDNK